MNYLLDTNIIIIFSRKDALTARIEKQYQLLNGKNNLYLSALREFSEYAVA